MKTKAIYLVNLLFICLLFLTGALPAYATTEAPELTLEEQVLQIIRSHPKVIIESVQEYQKQQYQEQQEKQQATVKKLAAHPQTLIGASPKWGSSQRVLLVEFSDFQCPFCAKAHQNVKQFVERHSQELTFVYKYLPLTQIHSQAMAAAKAAWAAGQQGKFWEYHDALFDQQKSLGEELYSSLAEQLGLNVAKFDRDRMGEAASAAIQRDIDLAEKLEVGGTPFFIMNGEVLSGAVSLAEFENKFAQINQASQSR